MKRALPLNEQPEALLSERLALTPRGPEHAARLFEVLSDPELWRFIPGDPPASAQTLKGRFARTKKGPVAGGERWWNWVVTPCESPEELFGTVEASVFDDGSRVLLAYMFARRSWGRGYAVEACDAVLAYVRKAAPVHVFEAFMDTRNVRSIALVERLGFRRLERIVAADYFKGSQSDEYRYGLETG